MDRGSIGNVLRNSGCVSCKEDNTYELETDPRTSSQSTFFCDKSEGDEERNPQKRCIENRKENCRSWRTLVVNQNEGGNRADDGIENHKRKSQKRFSRLSNDLGD
jgi:hypothetical protein